MPWDKSLSNCASSDNGGLFNFTLNTTNCHDGTLCVNPNSQACCFNAQGVAQVEHRRNGPLSTVAAVPSSCYSTNGHTMPTLTSSAASGSGSNTCAFTTSSALVTSTSASQPPAAPLRAPSSLSISEKFSIAVGTLVGICA